MALGFEFSMIGGDNKHFQKTLKALADDCGYGVDGMNGIYWVNICRLGEVFIDYKKGKDGTLSVTGMCQTNFLGAGFHKAAIEFVESLSKRLRATLDVNDSTGYYIRRDFEDLKSRFLEWLQELFRAFKENKVADETMKYICWNTDIYMPIVPDNVFASPFGYFRIPDTLELIEREGIGPMADIFLMWNDEEHDASFHLKQALNALWADCYFMPSDRSLMDYQVNGFIISELEKAIRMDPTLPFPMEAYYEVCMLHKHEPISLAGTSRYDSEWVIGYRKDWVGHKVGNVIFEVPGRDFDVVEGEKTVFYDDGETDWNSIEFAVYQTGRKGLVEFVKMDGPVIMKGDLGHGKYHVYDVVEKDDDGSPYPLYSVHVISDGQYTVFDIGGSSEKHRKSLAKRIVKSLRIDRPKNQKIL